MKIFYMKKNIVKYFIISKGVYIIYKDNLIGRKNKNSATLYQIS